MGTKRELLRRWASQGRAGDTKLVHATRGDVVIPVEIQTPQVNEALKFLFTAANTNKERFTVGAKGTQKNPDTGLPEFQAIQVGTGLDALTRPLGVNVAKPAPVTSPTPAAPTPAAPGTPTPPAPITGEAFSDLVKRAVTPDTTAQPEGAGPGPGPAGPPGSQPGVAASGGPFGLGPIGIGGLGKGIMGGVLGAAVPGASLGISALDALSSVAQANAQLESLNVNPLSTEQEAEAFAASMLGPVGSLLGLTNAEQAALANAAQATTVGFENVGQVPSMGQSAGLGSAASPGAFGPLGGIAGANAAAFGPGAATPGGLSVGDIGSVAGAGDTGPAGISGGGEVGPVGAGADFGGGFGSSTGAVGADASGGGGGGSSGTGTGDGGSGAP